MVAGSQRRARRSRSEAWHGEGGRTHAVGLVAEIKPERDWLWNLREGVSPAWISHAGSLRQSLSNPAADDPASLRDGVAAGRWCSRGGIRSRGDSRRIVAGEHWGFGA